VIKEAVMYSVEANTGDYRKHYFFYDDGQDLIGFSGGNIQESIEHFHSITENTSNVICVF